MKRHLLFTLFCFTIGFSWAQTALERPYRAYSTQSVQKRLLEQNPEFTANLQALEGQISQYGMTGDARKDTISLVFHILYTPGQPYPDETKILSQLEALNKDFDVHDASLEPFVFDKIQEMAQKAVNPGVYFCLPLYDANGNNFSPIRFIQTSTDVWKDDDGIKSSASGGVDPEDTKHFLNIWVGNLDNFSSGYAQMPGGPSKTDGIVIDPDFFGVSLTPETPYYKGKTLTHLIGSYLGLYELWNEGAPCGDDHVEDTPIHNAPNYGLGTNYHHVSLCDSTLAVEMVINFMDNTDDEALTMFTQGQKNRIKTVLSATGLRPDLTAWNHSCQPNGFHAADDREGQNPATVGTEPAFKLYPNPAKNNVYLEVSLGHSGVVTFTVMNVLGETITTSQHTLITGSQVFSQNCEDWSPGVYYIRAQFEDGTAITQSFYLDKP